MWSARLRAEIPAHYRAGKLSVSEIAELLNITPRTVARYLPGTTVRERRLHDVRVLRGRDVVPSAIADELGLSDRTVAGYLRED